MFKLVRLNEKQLVAMYGVEHTPDEGATNYYDIYFSVLRYNASGDVDFVGTKQTYVVDTEFSSLPNEKICADILPVYASTTSATNFSTKYSGFIIAASCGSTNENGVPGLYYQAYISDINNNDSCADSASGKLHNTIVPSSIQMAAIDNRNGLILFYDSVSGKSYYSTLDLYHEDFGGYAECSAATAIEVPGLDFPLASGGQYYQGVTVVSADTAVIFGGNQTIAGSVGLNRIDIMEPLDSDLSEVVCIGLAEASAQAEEPVKVFTKQVLGITGVQVGEQYYPAHDGCMEKLPIAPTQQHFHRTFPGTKWRGLTTTSIVKAD